MSLRLSAPILAAWSAICFAPPSAIASISSAAIYSDAIPIKAPIAAVLADLPTAVESFSPCNKSLVALARKPATAPPSGPPAIAAAAVRIATAILALPGLAFAQSLTTLTALTTLLSFSPIFVFSSANLASIF